MNKPDFLSLASIPNLARGLLAFTLVNAGIDATRREAFAAAPVLDATADATPIELERLDLPSSGGMCLPDGIGNELKEISGATQWRADEAARQLEKRFKSLGGKFVVIDGEKQTLVIAERSGTPGESYTNINWAYPVSTAKKGFGNQKDSEKTPTGVFRLGPVDGIGGDVGVVRQKEGYGIQIQDLRRGGAKPAMTTRFITMKGLDEENKGTEARSIGIHGTNREGSLGKADSGGCVRMDNDAVLVLSAIVASSMEGDGLGPYLVVIPPNDSHFVVPAAERAKTIDLRPKGDEADISGGWSDGPED